MQSSYSGCGRAALLRDNSTYLIAQHTHGESYGWDVRFLERGEFHISHDAFVTKAVAIRWAEEMRRHMERPAWTEPLPRIPIP